MRADHLLSVQALLGTPTASWQDIATIENVGGVAIETTGLFARPVAAEVEVSPTATLAQTDVQSALEFLANNIQIFQAAQGFHDATLGLPLQTYGIANEACESANVPAGDLLLSTTDAWQAALTNAANAGKNIFLNAGTYTISGGVTGILDLPNAPAGAPTQIKPQNCAAVTLSGRTRPCNYHVLAGLDLANVDTGTGGTAATIEFNRGETCTGTIVRNSLIRSVGRATVNFVSPTSATIVGNQIINTATGSNNSIRTNANPATVVIEANEISTGAGTVGALDTMGPSAADQWGGSYLFKRNWIHSKPAEELFDIKGALLPGSAYTFEDNYFDGAGSGSGICFIIQSAGPPEHPYTFTFRRNYVTGCPLKSMIFIIATGETDGEISEVTAIVEHNIFVQANQTINAIEGNRNNIQILGNTFISGLLEFGVTGTNPDPSGLVMHDNITYNTHFDGGDRLDTCARNLLFNTNALPTPCTQTLTTNPLFINPANNWHLQPGSPALGSGTDGLNRGAYTGAAVPSGGGSDAYPFSCNDTSSTSPLYLLYGSRGSTACPTTDTLVTDTPVVVTRTGFLQNLYCLSSAAPGGSDTMVYTARVDGVNSALTCTIVGAATTCNSAATSAPISAGDRLSLK